MILRKLQRKTLIPIQIVGYFFTLLIGVGIIQVSIQMYSDLKPLLFQESDVFSNNAAVVSKNVSLFKTLDKERIYFTETELEDLKQQDFVKDIAVFSNAGFKIKAFTEASAAVPAFQTDMFFESIPNKYLDIMPEDWKWDSAYDFIPVIIPESYLNLYNFGFAESQGLPVISKNIISSFRFNVQLSGNQQQGRYKSKIVGFSNKINSILVPEDFLLWANKKFASPSHQKASRILIEFKNPTDEGILAYFNQHNYSINKSDLEFNKLIFFFKIAFAFVLLIALIITLLSISFILLSINLIIQRNKETLLNLYDIGYSNRKIASFYQIVIVSTTLLSILFSTILSLIIRNMYMEKFKTLFEFEAQSNHILLIGIILILLLLPLNNYRIIHNVKKTTGE